MTQPAQPFAKHAKNLYRTIQQQSWLLFGMVIGVAIIDYFWVSPTFDTTKNCLAGGVLAWVGQWLFAKLALRQSGYRFRRQIVNNFYLAQAVKWLSTMAGFALIFLQLQPLKPLWVFVGYFTMQLGQIYLLYRYNYHQK